MLEGITLEINRAALKRHSFSDLISMRDFAQNMQAKLKRQKIKTSFDLRAIKHWKEVSTTLNFEMSKRVGTVFKTG